MELGNIKPNTHVLIEENNEIRALIGVRVGKRPGTDIAAAAMNFHYLLPDENDSELLQTVMYSLSDVFKKYNVSNFGFEVLENSPLRSLLKDIGFEFIKGEGGIYHSFKL
jgi:hypothetical protein